MLRFALPLMTGVILALFISGEDYLFWLYGVAVCLLILILVFRKKWKYPRYYNKFGFLYYSVLIISGYSLATINLSEQEKIIKIPVSAESGIAQLREPIREGPNSMYGVFELLAYKRADSLFSGKRFRFVLYTSKDSSLFDLQPGAQILFEGRIQPLRHSINPHQFDYASYLERKGIGGMAYASDNYEIIQSGPTTFKIENTFQILQSKCIQVFKNSGIGVKELSVLNALVLGYKSDLTAETKDEFANAGVVHILAVSGLHVGIIYIILQWIFGKVFHSKYTYLQFFLVVSLIWVYAGITGFSPSVLRASTMFSFIALGTIGGEKGNTYNMLAASVILLLLINPLIVREIGFQLSYLAVIGIVFLHDYFKPLFWSRYWLVQKGWELFIVSLSAQIATAPLSIYYFGQFPNYFFLSNLLVIPLATLSLYSGLLYLLLSAVPILSSFSAILSGLIVSMLTWVVSFFSSLPGSVTSNLYINILDVLSIYVLIVLIILINQRPTRLRIYLSCSVIIILVLSFSYKKINASIKSEMFILEGKDGSIAMLRNGENATFVPLYETTDSLCYQENEYYLSDLIKKEGIKHFDWVSKGPVKSNNILVKEGVVCFQDLVIIHSNSGINAPDFGFTILVLSNNQKTKSIQLDDFDRVILDRSFRNYNKQKVYEQLTDSSRVWDMNRHGVYRKTIRISISQPLQPR